MVESYVYTDPVYGRFLNTKSNCFILRFLAKGVVVAGGGIDDASMVAVCLVRRVFLFERTVGLEKLEDGYSATIGEGVSGM